MITRRMNTKIKFFRYEEIVNDLGETEDIKKDILFSCWAEVSKATVKEFRSRTTYKETGDDIQKRRNTLMFIVRYQQKMEVDSDMLIEFNGKNYEIKDIEVDYANQDFNMIRAEVIE